MRLISGSKTASTSRLPSSRMKRINTGSSHLVRRSSGLAYSLRRIEQPAAARGGVFELGDQQPRVIVAQRLLVDLDMLGPVEIQQFTSQLMNALARADRPLVLTGGDDDTVGDVPGADPLGAFGVDGQPGRLRGELAFAGVAWLDIIHPFLSSLVDAFGILGRQGGHQRERAAHA